MEVRLLANLIQELARISFFPKEIQALPWNVESNVSASLDLIAVDSGSNEKFGGVLKAMKNIDPEIFGDLDIETINQKSRRALIEKFISRNMGGTKHFCLSTTPGSDAEFLEPHEIYYRGHA